MLQRIEKQQQEVGVFGEEYLMPGISEENKKKIEVLKNEIKKKYEEVSSAGYPIVDLVDRNLPVTNRSFKYYPEYIENICTRLLEFKDRQ